MCTRRGLLGVHERLLRAVYGGCVQRLRRVLQVPLVKEFPVQSAVLWRALAGGCQTSPYRTQLTGVVQVINLQADGSGMYTLQGLWTQVRPITRHSIPTDQIC